MNRTQKGACVGLAGALFSIAIISFAFFKIFVLKKFPLRFEAFLAVGGFVLYVVLLILFLRQKQSLVEVEADERDKLVIRRAAIASFVSVWILLAVVSVLPRLVVGIDGSIPVWVVPIMNLGVMFAAMLVYSVAVLVQYGWRGADAGQ